MKAQDDDKHLLSTGPLVSVIIPTRNRHLFLQRALNSVLAQCYNNLEVIIIDDASEDSTCKVINNYKLKFDKIKAICNDNRCGGAEARNIGIRAASGKYIAFLDDDDEWLPEKTLRQVEVLEDNPDIGAVSCWYININKNRREKVKLVPDISYETILWDSFMGSFSLCMIRNDLAKIMRINPSLKSAQDWQFWIMVSRITVVSVIEEYLVNFHDHCQLRISNNPSNALAGRRKVYLMYKDYMSRECRKYRILNILQYRILLSRHSLLRKSYKLFRLGCKYRTSRFLLKRLLFSVLKTTFNLKSNDLMLYTRKYIKSL